MAAAVSSSTAGDGHQLDVEENSQTIEVGTSPVAERVPESRAAETTTGSPAAEKMPESPAAGKVAESPAVEKLPQSPPAKRTSESPAGDSKLQSAPGEQEESVANGGEDQTEDVDVGLEPRPTEASEVGSVRALR